MMFKLNNGISVKTEKLIVKWISWIVKCKHNFNYPESEKRWDYHLDVLRKILVNNVTFSEIYSILFNLKTNIITPPMYCEGIVEIYEMIHKDLLEKKQAKIKIL